jgi:A/G-specific adenine glycosylase
MRSFSFQRDTKRVLEYKNYFSFKPLRGFLVFSCFHYTMGNVKKDVREFRMKVLTFYRKKGRHLPWRETLDPYKILVSEIMLQQTQVERVIPFYKKFVKLFPDFYSLARATERSVLNAWQGLGYNRRALYLKRAAKIVVKEHNGKLPKVYSALVKLPGVGKGTVGALLAFAWNEPAVFIETNIRRAFLHHFFPKRRNVSDKALLPFIESALDTKDPRRWYSALMDYGTMLGTLPENPNVRSAQYKKQPVFKGSHRELRGKIIRLRLRHPRVSVATLAATCGTSPVVIRSTLLSLQKEGFAV